MLPEASYAPVWKLIYTKNLSMIHTLGEATGEREEV